MWITYVGMKNVNAKSDRIRSQYIYLYIFVFMYDPYHIVSFFEGK